MSNSEEHPTLRCPSCHAPLPPMSESSGRCWYCGTTDPRVGYLRRRRSGRTINTGGGAYIEGNIHVGGQDFVGGRIIRGDKVQGRTVDGDSFTLSGDFRGTKITIG